MSDDAALLMMAKVLEAQKPKAHELKDAPAFYRNMETILDKRRMDQTMLTLLPARPVVDFSSCDILSLSKSGLLRMAFMDELAKNPNFVLGSSGSRLMDGNHEYVEELEKEVAEFHGAETGLFFDSGFDANTAVFSVIPQPGDVIVFDELVHGSIHEGMRTSRATAKRPFKHNDVDSFREILTQFNKSLPSISTGTSTVLVSIESVYSMDGDVAPVEELLQAAKETLPLGNFQFFIDEAHSTGLMGPQGKGLVCALGLEKSFAVRLHPFSKALGSHGSVVLCDQTIKTMLLNFARCLIFSTAPSFPALAAIKGGYSLLKSNLGQMRQEALQPIIKHFFKNILAHPTYIRAEEAGILSIPIAKGWKERQFLTHIIPINHRGLENHLLSAHCQFAGYCVWPIDHPVVPKGQGRTRVIFHADNTFEQVDRLIGLITEWAELMLQRDRRGAEPLMAAAEGVNLDWLTKVVNTASSTMDEGVVYAKEVEVA
ncbi:class II aminotransferase/8-amino-7-oxononanoate synthase [Penicillium cf. griseofulvum]|uniref:Class II aminotransferase/8-amino-7-oxononanoate synthase n=1 Tax=Penicillium cf. griseofulvum TaxID=2972120 RepID=A0A9W9IVU8_9EURO|nr:class II aminotransferase/8-amino-7-oxononanoate synthase [Penicillium cf. griseofulvum]KAJ5430273.1 class II aminotransferase/8-amino-7-oxononanoate synthase [Penicillium cf. griseofulvum]KAJ5435957.1 class II aminotransferase/8-amino-7-oxononanoate synthase [Penicillium cf. griseofulvum]